MQIVRILHPPARLALGEAAVEQQLDIEPAQRRGRLEHLALDAASAVPARLPAGGGVERKDQPPAPAARPHRRRTAQIIEKCVDIGARRGRR
jgi:hypothetical protein